ncbi:hypothetical protein [Streptomyces sp. cg36]|uniref:hypothetical protein n=1 Tax=Streptomyces sp. cg36 TaxID=3238798 RepID=UPI0034E22DE7
MNRRCLAKAGALAAGTTGVLFAGVAPVQAAPPAAAADRVEIQEGPGVSWQADTALQLGERATRYLDVVSGHNAPVQLASSLAATGTLADAQGLHAGVRVCTQPWSAGGSCSGRATTLLAADTPLSTSFALATDSLPAHGTAHLQLAFSVPKAPSRPLDGTSARVTLHVTATGGTGATTPAGTGVPGGTGDRPASGNLASTGADLWPYAVLAAGLFAAGTVLATVRRRRAQHPDTTTPTGTGPEATA